MCASYEDVFQLEPLRDAYIMDKKVNQQTESALENHLPKKGLQQREACQRALRAGGSSITRAHFAVKTLHKRKPAEMAIL